MSARDEMLARIRTANAAAGAGPTGRLVPPVEVQHGDVDLFCENVADFRATVVRTRVGEVAGAIGRVVGDLGIGSLLVPAGADPDWTTALGPEVSVLQVDDGTAISHDELGAVGATLTIGNLRGGRQNGLRRCARCGCSPGRPGRRAAAAHLDQRSERDQ